MLEYLIVRKDFNPRLVSVRPQVSSMEGVMEKQQKRSISPHNNVVLDIWISDRQNINSGI